MLLPALLAALAADPCTQPLLASEPKDGEELARTIREEFVKYEYRVPMRDGVKLYTVVFVPRDRSQTWPILMVRTPYGVSYGVDEAPDTRTARAMARFAPSLASVKDGFIFVHQEVRGRGLSEGEFFDVRPRGASKSGTDEGTDAYDTVEFLLKRVAGHNGKVGVWGISYPGFYAAQAAVEAHPAVAAVSPQAPVTDWFLGDDFHHNGALFLEDAMGFFYGFGRARPVPTKKPFWQELDMNAGDSYDFYLALGPLKNANAPELLGGKIQFWNELMAHPNRDDFWKARDPRPRYKDAKPAILVVGGLFDAEDLWGTLATYKAFESQSPRADVRLVLGPWSHGGWARSEGDKLGDVSFGWKTSRYYQTKIELPFFRKYLKGCPEPEPSEAWVFETGTNVFERFSVWPPKDASTAKVYFAADGKLASSAPPEGFDEWPSDPAKPVPYRSRPAAHNDGEYMVDDQRFAARRPDVVVHQGPVLTEDLTVSGPVEVSLSVSTTGTDADFVVKLIDVYPVDRSSPDPNPREVRLAGYQQLVRGEVFRGRFRNSFEKPEPFLPGVPAKLRFTLPDVSHTFRPGHRLMIQVQSSWFPLVDRNPQRFVNIADAVADDFVKSTHRLYFGADSWVALPIRRGGSVR